MFDSFFSGDGFISIFFLLFIVAFVAILGMILVTFVRELSQRNRNNHSPRLTVEATVVATVTENPRLRMHWNGNTIVDVSREFLNSNGAEKHITIQLDAPGDYAKPVFGGFLENLEAVATDLNTCSKRGLSERFDSTIGAGTVLMPFGGKHQQTPIQAMVHKVSLEQGHTDTCSLMSWGYNPFITERSPYHGAYLAVVESAAKLVATGAAYELSLIHI